MSQLVFKNQRLLWLPVSDSILALLVMCPILLYVTPVRGVAIYIYSAFIPLLFLFWLARGVKINIYHFFLFLALGLFAISGLIYFNTGNSKTLLFSLNFFVSFMMAFMLFCRPKVALLASKGLVVFIFIWYFSCIFLVGYSAEDANNYLYQASRNHVSFLLILSLILYYATYIHLERPFSITPVMLMVPASIQLYGRSGILVSILLFFVVVSYRLFLNKKREDVIWLLVGLFFFSFILAFFLFFLVGFNNDYFMTSGFERGVESPRWAMSVEYLKSLDVGAIILGSDLRSIPLIANYDGNPHNSFIVGHSIFGIFFILALFVMLAWAGFKLMFGFSRKRLVLSLLFFLLVLRAYFDSLFFYSAFDYAFFYLFIILSLGEIEPRVFLYSLVTNSRSA